MTTTVGDGELPFPAGSPPAPLFYAHLNPTERAKISAVCTQFEQQVVSGGVPQLERTVLEAEPRLRLALLEQLLPVEIDYLAESRGGIPTLHELAVLYPNLEDLLAVAYPRLRSDVRLPDVLGVYRLVRVVGSGSQATIAIGRHKRLHQPVAIKFSRDEESSRRLLQEAAFLSRLDGLNVPEVIDDGRTPDGTAFFIMKYLEGRNLLELISERGPIRDPVTCAGSLLQIAETLAQLHDRGILHRDLSPKNIHVGDDGIWRIVDFGLAIDVASGTASRQDVKEFHGTPAFMAPEQISGDGSVDGKSSDLYALGRLLLFVASGLDAVLATMPESAANARIDHATRKNPVIPHRTLARIQAKATHSIPSQRYSSAAEMAGELKRFVQQTEYRRRWRRLLLRVAVVVVLGWGALWASGMIGDRREPTRSAEAKHSVNVAELAPAPPLPSEMIPLNAALEMELVQIPAGTFRRGSPPEDDRADADERPQQEVTLAKPIWISATEVTVEQFAAFVRAMEYQSDAEKMIASLPKLSQALAGLTGNAVTTWREPGFGQEPTHPVVNVSWNDAVQFCEWLSRQQHRNFRLPSEAEWEYACRAGSLTRFHFGDDPQQLPQHDHAAPLEPGSPQVFTRPVRDFPANKFGLFGLHGNVAEWCHDWYGAEHYASASEANPAGPETGEFRVRRGGAYNLPPEDCRSADRNGGRPEGMHPFVGFRIVDGGPISIAGNWKIVTGGSFGWSSPVVFNEDGTSSLGFGFWHFQWNGSDRFEVTDQNGAKPAAFGASDSAYTWDAKLAGDRLELSQQGKLKITLERIR